MNETYAQRMRVIFSTADTVKYVGHLDMHRAWERAIRRAGLPLAYTQGFNPQARLQFAAALPVGFTGQGEVADVFLNEALDPAEFLSRLTAALPPGIRPLRAEPVAREVPSLQSQVCGARYRVEVETGEPDAAFVARLDDFLARHRGVARAAQGQRRGALRPAAAGAGAGLHRAKHLRAIVHRCRCAPSQARRGGPTSCWRSWTSRPRRAALCGLSCCLRDDNAPSISRLAVGLVERNEGFQHKGFHHKATKTPSTQRSACSLCLFVSWRLCGEDLAPACPGEEENRTCVY